MNFMSKLENTFSNSTANKVLTENGAVGYASTMNPLLDMNFKVSSYRHMSEEEIISDFIEAYNFDKVYALKWLFFVRDAREGLGERRLFRVIMKYLANVHKDEVIKLLPLFAEYGRWDDVLELYSTSVRAEVIELITEQILEDEANMKNNKPISLICKWMPSINTSSRETVALARKIASDLKLSERNYRKMLSTFRAYLNVVEVVMSANNWGEIKYESVPSKANLIYKDAFLKHDEDRRAEYLDSLQRGEIKINSSVNYPHDIVHRYGVEPEYYGWRKNSSKLDITLEEMWKALPEYGIKNTIVVADGSGSMTIHVDPISSTTALEVANALAIYCAQHNEGEFKNKYITFSARPQLVNVNADTLLENIKIALKHCEVANTNIEAVFKLILNTAVENKLSQEEIPQNILIISDMEFDAATDTFVDRKIIKADATLFETLAEEYDNAGYVLPRLIFWNVNSRSGAIPVKQNEAGVALVSGFSPAVLKMVMSGKLDPWECLRETLDGEKYAPVAEALN